MSVNLDHSMVRMLAWQVVGSINVLRDDFDSQGNPNNCCPVCCGPCAELLRVLDDPYLLEDLNSILALISYVGEGGWDYWDRWKCSLKVKKIKKLWFNKDGSHKAICVMSNGVDESEDLHAAIREGEAKGESWRG